MIFHELVRLYNSLADYDPEKLGDENWAVKNVHFTLELDDDGSILPLMPLGQNKKPILMLMPNEERTSGDNPFFLGDTADYILGLNIKNNDKQAKRRHSLSGERHLNILENANGAAAKAIKNFFIKYQDADLSEHEEIAPFISDLKDSFIVFKYNNELVTKDPEIANIWETYNIDENLEKGFCIIYGKEEKLVDIHPSVKSVGNAQATARLISFGAESFTSYGKKGNNNAKISKKAAVRYAAALNYLLKDKKRTFKIGDLTVTCWVRSAERGYSEVIGEYIENGIDLNLSETKNYDKDLRKAIKNLSQGHKIQWNGESIDPQYKFFLLGLAGNNGRIAVNFFWQNNFGNIVKNISEHEECLQIVKPKYAENRAVSFALVIDALKPKDDKGFPITEKSGKNLFTILKQDLFKSVIFGTKYPKSLFYYAIDRFLKDSHIKIKKKDSDKKDKSKNSNMGSYYDWVLAAIIKAFILRNMKNNKKLWEVCTVELNEQTENQPYLLGRLLAVVERFQRASESREINSTIKDQYLQSFCINPSRVFSKICFAKEVYEEKLSKEKLGLAVNLDKVFNEVTEKIQLPIAKRQNMEEQAAFLLGYYHQEQKLWEKQDKNIEESVNYEQLDIR